MTKSYTNSSDCNVKDTQMHAWITAIAMHDEQALANLYEDTLARVYGVGLRITRNPQAAEEISGDVYWQVWREASRFNTQRGNVMAWLLTITRSRALDYLRKENNTEFCEKAELLLINEASLEGDPQDLLSAIQSNRKLNQSLQLLDPVQRQLVAMSFFRGLTHDEITAFTGLPLGTVKSHIRRALKQLHGVLEDNFIKGLE